MNYLYYCKKNNYFISSIREDVCFSCVRCNLPFTPLQITADSWNTLSNTQKQLLLNSPAKETEPPSENRDTLNIETISISEKDRKKTIIKELHSYVDNLVDNGIDVEPPNEWDECILIPVNCWFDKKVYIALYLLRYHKIAGIKLSYHELPQLQVYVKKDNIELIVQSCSEITLRGGTDNWEKDFTYIDTYNHVMNNHPVMRWYMNPQERSTTTQNNDVDISKYEEWKKEYRNHIYKEAISEYGKMKYNSEFRLFFFVRFLFPDAMYQYHAEWLGQQSLDIFIQSINVGIEYQGKQHYKPVDYFGGESKFEQQQQMDFVKKQKCIKHGVKLFEWSYKKLITETNLLRNAHIWYPGDYSWITHEYLLCNMKRMCPRTIDDFLNYIQIRHQEDHITKLREKKKPKKPKYVYRKYDPDGVFIKEYTSVSAAAQDCSVSVTSIMKACKGKRKTAAGNQWCYYQPELTGI